MVVSVSPRSPPGGPQFQSSTKKLRGTQHTLCSGVQSHALHKGTVNAGVCCHHPVEGNLQCLCTAACNKMLLFGKTWNRDRPFLIPNGGTCGGMEPRILQ